MRIVKKYANRKLYDTVDKMYVTMDVLSELIKSGEEIQVIDNRTGDDITASVVSQLLAREKGAGGSEEASGVLVQLLRKSGLTVRDYAKRYAALWQGTVHMAEDEIDKIVDHLVKDREISRSEGEKLKEEMVGHSESMKEWIGRNVDRRLGEVLAKMNLATRGQVRRLTESIEELAKKVDRLEHFQKGDSSGKQAPPAEAAEPDLSEGPEAGIKNENTEEGRR